MSVVRDEAEGDELVLLLLVLDDRGGRLLFLFLPKAGRPAIRGDREAIVEGLAVKSWICWSVIPEVVHPCPRICRRTNDLSI